MAADRDGSGRPPPAVRPEWLAQVAEAPLEPDLPIIDPHHHFSVHTDEGYGVAALQADLASGHRIEATVYIECRANYRADGPLEMRPVGETEHVVGSVTAQPRTRHLCAGIVGYADLMLGATVLPVLEAQIAAGKGRFKGIRNSTVSHPDPAARGAAVNRPAQMLMQPQFREGFRCLAPLGLSFDSWIYHTQIHELVDLARAFPDTTVVIDHVGGVLGIGPYAGRRDEVFADWKAAMRALAACPNTRVKLGGLGMRLFGFGFEDLQLPPTSEQLAAAWRPYIETCVDLFGVDRAMLESNFPVDKASCSYGSLWNAMKRITAGCSAGEKAALFRDTARRTYRL
jgi:L-fuconolactonase